MTRLAVMLRLQVLGFILFATLLCCVLPIGAASDEVCPNCEAPVAPGAVFCVRCGHKLGPAGAVPEKPHPDERDSVVQVVTVHDTELTSTFASIAFDSNLRVDSVLGSAFAIAPGEFVTESGLLVGAKEVLLRTQAGRTVKATVIGSDAMIGVALLKANLPEIKALTLRLDEPPRPGESLKAAGFPIGARAVGKPILSTGIVSGLHRSGLRIHPIEDYFQTDASLPRGLAGGPMLDDEGRVVGMSTGLVFGSRVHLGPQSGIGYAIPAKWIRRAIKWIRDGAIPRAWIGAYVVPVDPDRRAHDGFAPHVKLVIDQVFPGSSAAVAGLKRGDGLLNVQEQEITNLPRLQHQLLPMQPGDTVTLEVTRAGETLRFSLSASLRPNKPRLKGIDALRFFGDLEIVPQDGKRLVVASVTPGSELAQLKIEPGDILRSILSKKDWAHGAKDNSRWRRVRTVADLEARLETAYSDLDFCLGLRFRSRDGEKRDLFLWEIL
ncbi:MAG: trypsin-like peptidase domain-containing protein, partial [Acidobacteria bacterium]|nr:trypsin-like peptidase domain-containing protein [Acidobacteriota bacterium]